MFFPVTLSSLSSLLKIVPITEQTMKQFSLSKPYLNAAYHQHYYSNRTEKFNTISYQKVDETGFKSR
jgi:hypothetical protein